MRFGRILAGVVAVACVALPAAAAAQEYPPQTGDLTVSASSVAPGGSITASGGGCSANAAVTMRFDDTTVGSVTTSGTGDFSANVSAPAGASSGTHTVSASCPTDAGPTLVLSASVTVVSAGGGLARTGGDNVLPIALVATGLLLVGAVLAATMRRRRGLALPH